VKGIDPEADRQEPQRIRRRRRYRQAGSENRDIATERDRGPRGHRDSTI